MLVTNVLVSISVDSSSDVKNCGGCGLTGQGTDCTKIANADLSSVSCSQSLCVGKCPTKFSEMILSLICHSLVNKCASGYEPSDDDSYCVKA